MTTEPKPKVMILWRCKAIPGVKDIARAKPAGPWQPYKEMSMKEASEFLAEAEKAKDRISFEYCIDKKVPFSMMVP